MKENIILHIVKSLLQSKCIKNFVLSTPPQNQKKKFTKKLFKIISPTKKVLIMKCVAKQPK